MSLMCPLWSHALYTENIMSIKRLGIIALFLITMFVSICPQEGFADSFDTYMERCEPYRETIERILVEEGVPKEYFALLLAESGCDLDNVSNRGAKGAWQLMDATARTYGVKDPNDLEQSTRGAARYLKSLIDRFHTMEWVVAAYNAGGTNLKRVTGYPNAEFSKVRKVRPEAYGLAMKVTGFVKRIQVYDKQHALQIKETEISIKDVETNEIKTSTLDG